MWYVVNAKIIFFGAVFNYGDYPEAIRKKWVSYNDKQKDYFNKYDDDLKKYHSEYSVRDGFSHIKDRTYTYIDELDETGMLGTKILDVGSGCPNYSSSRYLIRRGGKFVVGVDIGIEKAYSSDDSRFSPYIFIPGDVQEISDILQSYPVVDFWKKHLQDGEMVFDTVLLIKILCYVEYRKVFNGLLPYLKKGSRLLIYHDNSGRIDYKNYNKGIKDSLPKKYKNLHVLNSMKEINTILEKYNFVIEHEEILGKLDQRVKTYFKFFDMENITGFSTYDLNDWGIYSSVYSTVFGFKPDDCKLIVARKE
ncbi:hypothetical protein ACFL56_00775 [Candidatus Margulisiibacteriota bacterium]